MTSIRREWMKRVAGGALAGLLNSGAYAQLTPARVLRLVVVYPPGGVSDAAARHLAQGLGSRLDIPVVVEHRPGGGGRIGLAALARAPADGQTLVFSAITPLTLQPHASPELDRIEPVAAVMITPQLVVATPSLRVSSLSQALAHARAHPGGVRWASSGVATTGHLIMEHVAAASGSKIVHVPYQGGGRQLNDALGGQFELLSTNVGALQLRYIATGQLTALAVGAPTRLQVLPHIPTLAEAGYPAANLSSLFGVFAAPGTRPELLDSLNAAINDVIRSPAFLERLALADNLPANGSRHDFARRITQERDTSGSVLRFLGR